jgi:hypothetical protein
VIPDVPPFPDVPADPVTAIRTQNEDNGLALHARTAMPGWLGERLNLGYAIDVLHPLATDDRRGVVSRFPTAPELEDRGSEVEDPDDRMSIPLNVHARGSGRSPRRSGLSAFRVQGDPWREEDTSSDGRENVLDRRQAAP